MNWSFSLTYPWWFVPLCLLLGAGYAAILYYKSPSQSNKLVKVGLPILRFLLASTLAFILLGPVLRYSGYKNEKPILSLLVDNSASIGNKNGEKEVVNAVDKLKTALSEKFKIDVVSVSGSANPTAAETLKFEGTETNLSRASRFLNQNYVNQNLGAAVLISDGIYNAGSDPVSSLIDLRQPVYTIGVGDTTRYSDFKIASVQHNSISYLGNDFIVRAEIQASLLKGKVGTLRLLKNGRVLSSKPVVINNDNFYAEVEFDLTASKVGQNKYVLQLNTFANEVNKSNNASTFYIDVIDGKKKVNIWANAPHPDLGALRDVINQNKNYEAKIVLKDFAVSDEIDLVVLHNWFANNSHLVWFEKMKSSGIPALAVFGNKFKSSIYNQNSTGIKFNPTSRGFVAALPHINQNFEFFDFEESTSGIVKKWSPLKAPFGTLGGIKQNEIVLYQTIGSVKTESPLLWLGENARYRSGVLLGTGLWQWRLLDYEKNENHETISELINKVIQYLSVKDEKKLLKVYASSRQYGVGEQVNLLGELYNQSLDPISNQEIAVVLTNDEGKNFKYLMSPRDNQYKLNLKNLEQGSYTFNASATIGGVKLFDKGYFTITGKQKEFITLTADHGLLRKMAKATKAQFYTPGSVEQLAEELLASEDFKTVITEDNKTEELIKFKWLFWILLALLTLEWFVRKWNGGL